MTKPRKKRRTANARQCVENLQRITQRKSDRVAKALTAIVCRESMPVPAQPKKLRSVKANDGSDPDRYVGYSAVGRQKMRGSSKIPRGVY
ncbi:hypothetical protein PEC730217_37040 [Pectobacterium carotovorum subsp. carotovorum]|uniref:hypothetical protein n=1 Tax=Pectobacterium versatile TaxID=2488639 RepID=UPI000CFE3812|nr:MULTISPECIES: hypothetical protein [Pectobacterium]MBD0844889.1 hypothetical protein [Pectobacterium carotovorum subsp. carotovorum]MBK4826383.1 hypothetical protein [Pectobacterium carotovorum subsp. carotovorum]PRI19443.1 hypothetical protein BZY99_12960 [Pectobacterium versatile]UNE80462.1 hypothetical protein IMY97_22885 [Pectobacterium versatile]GKW34924.1 hypothetical protein PEC730217_37040 [Pectobacterium carotovorum subsp. carotovorum]